jgi:hypothetical protein
VSARPRVRAAAAADPPRRGPGLAIVICVALLVVAGGAVGVVAFNRREAAQQAEVRARREAELAAQQAADDEAFANARAAWRDFLAALPAPLVTNPLPPELAEKRAAELRADLVGTWRGGGAAGGTREVEYRADGTFRDAVTGPGAREWRGEWAVIGPSGRRVLRVTRSGGGPDSVKLAFEGDELVHDDEPGVATVLRRR